MLQPDRGSAMRAADNDVLTLPAVNDMLPLVSQG
jgi:hypothetical protein